MAFKSLAAAALAAVIGAGALSATATPAAADGFYFGFTTGDGPRYSNRLVERRWHDDRYYRVRDHRRWDRPHRVQVCEPAWKVKRVYDRWGRVEKVIRTRVDECRWVRR